METLKTKSEMLRALEEAGEKYPHLNIGSSYMTLMDYERKGVVDKPINSTMIGDREWRFYTDDEIKVNVKKIVNYKILSMPTIKE